MNCPECERLYRLHALARDRYIEALASEFFKVSTRIAAKTRVDMERAKLDFDNHTLACPNAMMPRLAATASATEKAA